jgi:hypothetical protein
MTIQKPASMSVSAPEWDERPACSVCIAVDADAVRALYDQTLCTD